MLASIRYTYSSSTELVMGVFLRRYKFYVLMGHRRRRVHECWMAQGESRSEIRALFRNFITTRSRRLSIKQFVNSTKTIFAACGCRRRCVKKLFIIRRFSEQCVGERLPGRYD